MSTAYLQPAIDIPIMTVPQTESPEPLFEQSSQFRNWRYSKTGLATLREELNQGAVSRVKGKVEEERSTSSAKTETQTEAPPSQVTYLTVADEQNLVKFYLHKIPQLSKAFQFNDAVASTGMSYLKRFYLRNTCMDYHPKNIMLTCLFLATKTENQLISINTFAAKLKGTTPADILSLEFLVSQSLRFQFKVHHAHLAAYGLFLDLQTIAQDTPISTIEQVFTQASALIKIARLSDLEFFYMPSQIALAGFYTIDAALVESWLLAKQPGVTNDNSIEHQDVLQLLQRIAQEMKDIKEPKVEDVREVDKRLKFCRNPEKDPNSSLYQKHKAEQEQADHKRRVKKAQDEALPDPFGKNESDQPTPLPSVKQEDDDPFK